MRAGDIDICASRANRIIYHDDTDNIIMQLNEDFADLITEAKVFLISGFNAMHERGAPRRPAGVAVANHGKTPQRRTGLL